MSKNDLWMERKLEDLRPIFGDVKSRLRPGVMVELKQRIDKLFSDWFEDWTDQAEQSEKELAKATRWIVSKFNGDATSVIDDFMSMVLNDEFEICDALENICEQYWWDSAEYNK